MKTKLFFCMFFSVIITQQTLMAQYFNYPKTRKVDTVDVYFGNKVADPYRWLEDDRSDETAAWVKLENQVTSQYLARIPFRNKIRDRFTSLWNYPKYGVPFREGKYYFFFKNDGLQNQSVLYIQEGLTGAPRLFLDPNIMSEDGTVSIGGIVASNDAKYLAYSRSTGGSDWNEIHIMDIASGKELGEVIKWVKFSSISWYKDGFYYSRYDAPAPGKELSKKNEFHKVYYHKTGTQQSEDVLVYESREHPLRNYGTQVTEDEKFLLVYESESTDGVALYCKRLGEAGANFVKIAEGFDHEYGVIDNIDEKLLVMTNYEAPRKKIVVMNPNDPSPEKWGTVIPEKEDVLQWATLIGGKLFAAYMKDAYSKVYIYDLSGKQLGEMILPAIGTLSGLSGKKNDNTAFYAFTSFTYPTTIFKYDVVKNKSEVYRAPEIDFKTDAYETKQIFYYSKDSTRIPMFIVHKKGLVLDDNNPTYLYGYGGFNVSMTPGFSISRLIFLENGGVFAMPCIRGGGEYGEEWHKAGTKLQKQNVFDDFIAAAEYLIAEKYTKPEKLAIAGGSNGGLLVGACMTQRPELFKVALPAVGVMDMLRFHKFTIGWAWTGDYGSSDNKEEFLYIYKYSPLHNIKSGVDYPATLVTTADHDDRVVPAHSFKFIATLQDKNTGPNPVLIRIETMAGHGSGKPTSKVIDEVTDVWSFVFFNLGMSVGDH